MKKPLWQPSEKRKEDSLLTDFSKLINNQVTPISIIVIPIMDNLPVIILKDALLLMTSTSFKFRLCCVIFFSWSFDTREKNAEHAFICGVPPLFPPTPARGVLFLPVLWGKNGAGNRA